MITSLFTTLPMYLLIQTVLLVPSQGCWQVYYRTGATLLVLTLIGSESATPYDKKPFFTIFTQFCKIEIKYFQGIFVNSILCKPLPLSRRVPGIHYQISAGAQAPVAPIITTALLMSALFFRFSGALMEFIFWLFTLSFLIGETFCKKLPIPIPGIACTEQIVFNVQVKP